MNILDKYNSFQWWLISLTGAIFISYPNIASLPWELSFLDKSDHPALWMLFFIRYFFFVVLIRILLPANHRKIHTTRFGKRFGINFILCASVYLLFILFFLLTGWKMHGYILLGYQFFVICIITTFTGHISQLYAMQQNKELEIGKLKVENLQSRCNALASQINPHFFFNSLNGLVGLIRKKEQGRTLEYVNKLSDIFRYILQSDKKGLVTLREELAFVESYRYMMEVRFAHKLRFETEVGPQDGDLKLPVLTLLPLIENIIENNIIDSEHLMRIRIFLNEQKELVIMNPVYPKMKHVSGKQETEIQNLKNRYALLMGQNIHMENNELFFTIYLPLKEKGE